MSTYPPKEAAGSYFERPAIIEQLRAESRGLPYRPAKRKRSIDRRPPGPYDAHRLFTVENGNRWMELARREPEAKMLLGELWHQGELCMLFADTNTGKSVLAVQIGESIARGESIAPFTCQTEPSRVLYMDFELNRRQFGLRYSQGEDDYQFSDNFFRAEYNFLPDPPPGVDENELLIAAIEYKIKLVKANVLIIDNITCLRGGTENSAVALSLVKSLKALKNDHNLSILVLAHTPKRRNATKPISADDLHGSKLLVNFADSAFALGKSTADTGLCYLKQIKQRNTRQRYGDDNVCLCRLQKPGTFLHFDFEGNTAESHHLLSRTSAERRRLADEIAALSAAGFSQREISRQLSIGLATVNRLLRGGYRCTGADEGADMPVLGFADSEECAENAGAADKTFKAIATPDSTCPRRNFYLGGCSEAHIPLDNESKDLTCGMPPETPTIENVPQTKPPLTLNVTYGLTAATVDSELSPVCRGVENSTGAKT
ncbi:AAA family ATPase [Mucilaginibacter sp. L3T2-6]|uniref:AAA family ATPase n=1 Tax=Mucilaginibacter sp. L3T2-6 TaxID=3062491 RepID=UPI00267575A3|nr:AAA family ATPase [Mucilaginibacter sp. L3T2-6]MDO3642812.1 AAA family ATPase [Mucilaginibacter sp. L3T2-6]MDV6215461.1 AAA family ATPase [Mucilaginibacter sp. L3T2-6]